MSDDMISEFVAESSEHLTRAEEILLGFSRKPDQEDTESINACFRSLHTIKGCSGFLDLTRIKNLAHAGEQILDALRTGELKGSSAIFDVLLSTVSRLQAHVAQLNGQPIEIPESDDDCVQQLESLRHSAHAPAAADVASPTDVSMAASAAVHQSPGDAISTAMADLIVSGHGDPTNVSTIIQTLAQAMMHGAWASETRPLMTQMRYLVDGLSGPQASDNFHNILKLCQHMESVQRLVSSGDASGSSGGVTALAVPVLGSVAEPLSASDANQATTALNEYIAEATELLSQAEATVIGGVSFNAEQVNTVFRAFHTVKGMSAYLGQTDVEKTAHQFEASIQAVRDGTAPADEAFSASVLSGIDALRERVNAVKRQLVMQDNAGASSAVAVRSPASASLSTTKVDAPVPVARIGDLLEDLGVSRKTIEVHAAQLKTGERLGDKMVAAGAVTRQQVEKAAQVQNALKTGGDVFSRVATSKLEELMNQVGELLIAQAMVQHNPELQPNSHLAQAVGRQGRILRNLQVLSLSLRMVPLRGTFQKMARVVYDTAKKIGKQVDFTLGGEDTEIDRTLAETMSDPLMHMVRNGIDHGIESPEVRIKNGKPAAGSLRLEAFQSGDDVVIRLIDDGAGMDPERLRAKAIEKGLISSTQPMDEQACYQIIFLPGFSTAAKVTDVSGRGVGMDVVRRQVQEAKGSVHIASVLGKGTTFTIRLPMTTAILDAMQLKVGAENLLMPIGSIVEMLRPQPGQVQTVLDRGQVIQHRKRTLPLVHLGQTLGISGCESDPEQAILVVIDNHGSDFVIQVDAILGQRQVVIKPFDASVSHHPGISGTTILGDGRVAVILNPNNLVHHTSDASPS